MILSIPRLDTVLIEVHTNSFIEEKRTKSNKFLSLSHMGPLVFVQNTRFPFLKRGWNLLLSLKTEEQNVKKRVKEKICGSLRPKKCLEMTTLSD